MLLTKKQTDASGVASSPFIHSLRRGLSQALPTLDRRSFLRRSGLGVGVGLAASQLSLVQKAQAATGASIVGAGKVEVKRRATLEAALTALGPDQYDRLVAAGRSVLRQRPSLAGHVLRIDMVALAPGRFPRHRRGIVGLGKGTA